MTSTYIAIDSGGTRTNVTLAVESDTAPEVRQRREVPFALSGYLNPKEYESVFRNILAPIEASWRELELEGTDVYLFVSAAGFAESTRDLFLDLIKTVIPTAFGGSVKAVGVANDGVALLLGYDSSGAVVAGTGSTVLVRSAIGDIHQAGGNDWVAADYGAGFWIGLESIRAVARALESGRDTTLLQRFCSEYHVSQEDESALVACFRRLAVADHDMKAEIAKFATSVCAAAQKGDEEAQRIVKFQAEDLAASLATALRRRLAGEEFPSTLDIVLCGSVMGNTFYRSAFEAMVTLTLFSGSDDKGIINWKYIEDGTDATFDLAKRLETDRNSMLDVGAKHRPIVLSY